MNMSIKQDEQDPLMAGGEDGIVAGISGSAGPGEPRPPTLQVEHTTYGFLNKFRKIININSSVITTRSRVR